MLGACIVFIAPTLLHLVIVRRYELRLIVGCRGAAHLADLDGTFPQAVPVCLPGALFSWICSTRRSDFTPGPSPSTCF